MHSKIALIISCLTLYLNAVQGEEVCLPYSPETGIFEGQILEIYKKENIIEVLIFRVNRQWNLVESLLEGEEVLIDVSEDYNKNCSLPITEKGSIMNFIVRPSIKKTLNSQKKIFIIPGGIIDQKSRPTTVEEADPSTTSPEQSPIVETTDQCVDHKCQLGARCEMWNEVAGDGSAQEAKSPISICICSDYMELKSENMCSEEDEKEYCGSDGKVYSDMCYLIQESCLNNKNITVLHGDLNLDVDECLFIRDTQSVKQTQTNNEEYMQDERYNPRFEMEQRDDRRCELENCPSNDILNEVCGTDKVVYGTSCLLDLKSCYTHGRVDATKIQPMFLCEDYNSKYEICKDGIVCKDYGKCLNDQGNELSSCDCSHIDCTNEWPDRVCGDDGNTYLNRCHLIKTACEQQKSIKVLYRGFCLKNPCEDHKCEWKGEQCKVDATNGQPYCECEADCQPVFLPVCGNDGVTYDSICHLKKEACRQRKELYVKNSGFCENPAECINNKQICKSYEICSAIKTLNKITNEGAGNAQCVCPVCPSLTYNSDLGGPVCGSDGRTYVSECHFNLELCQQMKANPNGQLQLFIKERAQCDNCKDVICANYAKCQMNQQGQPICVCPTECTYTNEPVCGSDGLTYENECYLKIKSCNEQRDIRIQNHGECKKCPGGCPLGQQCLQGACVCRSTCPVPFNEAEKFCGTDGNYYPSECELNRRACLDGKRIEIDSSLISCNKKNPMDTMFSDTQSIQLQAPISICNCDPKGTINEICDSKGQCPCKQFFEGKKCDRCVERFWRSSKNTDCQSCNCNEMTSVSNVCNQNDGSCDCKYGFRGKNCEICDIDPKLKPDECIEKMKLEFDTSLSRRFEQRTGLMMKIPLKKFLSDTQCVGAVKVKIDSIKRPEGFDETNLLQIIYPGKNPQITIESRFSLTMDSAGLVVARFADSSSPEHYWMAVTSYPIPRRIFFTIIFGITEKNVPWIQIGENGQDFYQVVIGTKIAANINLLAPISLTHETIWVGSSEDPVSTNGNGFQGCVSEITFENTRGNWYSVDMFTVGEEDRSVKAIWIGTNFNPEKKITQAPMCRESSHELQATSICDSSPCRNNGICETEDNVNFKCVCQPGKTGKFCELKAAVVPEFNGVSSYVNIKGPMDDKSLKHRRFEMFIDFLPKKSPGFIFSVLSEADLIRGAVIGPYLVIYQKSETELVIGLRSGNNRRAREAFARPNYNPEHGFYTTVPIKPNEWSSLFIRKRQRNLDVWINQVHVSKIKLITDNYLSMPLQLRRAFTNFNFQESRLFLGAFPDVKVHFPFQSDVSANFWQGAIQHITLNDAGLILSGHNSPEDNGNLEKWVDVRQYDGFPCGRDFDKCKTLPHDVCVPNMKMTPMGVIENVGECKCGTPLENFAMIREVTQNQDSAKQIDLAALITVAEEKLCESKRMPNDEPIGMRSPITMQKAEKAPEQMKEPSLYLNGQNVFRFDYLSYQQEASKTDIFIKIRTRDEEGLVMLYFDEKTYLQTGKLTKTDFLLVTLRNGRIEVSLNLKQSSLDSKRSSLIRLVSERKINDFDWHEIHILRELGLMTLLVDNYIVRGEISYNNGELHTNGQLLFGGTNVIFDELPNEYRKNVTACISSFMVDSKSVDLLIDSNLILGPINKCES